jgi:hypothetical protein
MRRDLTTSSRVGGGITDVHLELDVLSPAERRDLANALLRAAWSAVLEETRIVLLDLLVEVDDEEALSEPECGQ